MEKKGEKNWEVFTGNLERVDGKLYQVISDIPIYSPPIPPVKEIIGWDMDVKDCKWDNYYKDLKLPESFKRIKFDSDGNPLTLTDEQQEIIDMHWDRRWNGFWFFININGEKWPMWITGTHYLYLVFWTLDTGRPFFRDTDRREFWFMWYCEEDPYCLGGQALGRRQDGKSARAGCWIYDRSTKGKMRHGGIQSKNDTDGKAFFQKFVIRGWRRLPYFFTPQFEGSTSPTKKIEFKAPAVKGKKAKMDGQVAIEDELESLIEARSSGELAFDGESLYTYIGDEEGKTDEKEANIVRRWNVVKPSLLFNGKVRGKSWHTSTAEEMVKGGGQVYLDLWKDSCFFDKDPRTKRTSSGLYRYFKPAYDGYILDDYGMSLIQESIDALEAEFEQEQDPAKRMALKRKHPFTAKDAFRTSGNQCAFNIIKITSAEEWAETFTASWQPYLLHWKEVKLANGLILKQDTEVVATPDSGGRHFFRNLPTGQLANRVSKDFRGKKKPENNQVFAGAIDPYNAINPKTKTPSKGACTYFRKYDMFIDPKEKPKREWLTNRFMYYYCSRPPGGPKVFFEDMVMVSHFLGAEVLIEDNKENCYHYFLERGYENFVSNKPQSAMSQKELENNTETSNVTSTTLVQNAYFGAIDQYVEDYWELLDCGPIIQDWKEMEHGNMTPYDLGVCSGLTLLQVNKYIRPVEKVVSGKPYIKKYPKRR